MRRGIVMNNAVIGALNNPKISATVAAITTGAGIDGWILKELPQYLSITATILGIILAGYLILNNHRLAKKTKLEIKILQDQAKENKIGVKK